MARTRISPHRRALGSGKVAVPAILRINPVAATRTGAPAGGVVSKFGYIWGVDVELSPLHILHIKRKNLVLDEQLLEEATRIAGGATYFGTVNLALRDFVRRARARRILELAGSGLWEGSLPEIRRYAPPRPRRRSSR